MKTPASASPRSSSPVRRLSLLVTLACAGLVTASAQAQESQLDVGVRSNVADSANSRATGPGQTFGILSVEEIKSDLRLVSPVDERALLSQLLHELEANGFREFTKGHRPDILLTVSYGRGGLRNPYFRGNDTVVAGVATVPAQDLPSTPDGVSEGPGSIRQEVPTLTVTMASPQRIFDEKTPGFESKLQRAGYEKLFIRVTAWQYPAGSGKKNKQLWKTIMVVDDPDHRDLNLVAAQMLEAGAAYFGKEIKDPEVDVYKPLPNGQVRVGSPEVIPTSGQK